MRKLSGTWRWLIGLLLGLLLLAGALAWLAGSVPALRWAVQRAVQASDGALTIEGLDGSLYGGATVERLAWQQPDGLRVELRSVELRWLLAPLIERELAIESARAREVRVETVPSDDPPALPDSLALPFNLRLDDLSVNLLTVAQRPRPGRPAAAPLELKGIRLALRYRDGRHALQRLALTSQWGTFEASGQIADVRPFDLALDARLVARIDGWGDPVPATLRLDGPLEAIAWRGEASLRDAQVRFGGTLRPLRAEPVGTIDIDSAPLELQRFADRAPQARLRIAGSVTPRLADGPGAQLTGKVSVSNETPGKLDASLLPVESVETSFALEGERLRLSGLAVALADGATVRGQGTVDLSERSPPGAAASPLSRLDLRLQVARLDAASLYGALVPTALSGDLRLDAKGVAVDLRDAGELLSGGLGISGLFNFDGNLLSIEGGELRARDGALRVAGRVDFAKGTRIDLKGSARRFATERWITLPSVPGGHGWRGVLNGQWQASGEVAPALDLRASVTLADSRLNGRPLAGSLRAGLLGPAQAGAPVARVRDVDLRLQYAGARVEAHGSLGASGDQLDYRLQSQSLAELDPRLHGQLAASGEARGSFAAPALRGQLRGSGIGWRAESDAYRAGSLRASFELADHAWGGGEGRVMLQASAEGMQLGKQVLESLNANIDGTAAAHRLRASAVAAGQRLTFVGSGRYEAPPDQPWSWAAQVAALEVAGPLQLSLRQPAELLVRPGAVSLERAEFALAQGRLTLAGASFADQRFTARGDFEAIAVDRLVQSLQRLAPEAIDPSLVRPTGLVLRGRFELAGASVDDLTGNASFDTRSTLFDAHSQGQLTFASGNVEGSLRLALPSLAWARGFIGNDWRVDGALRFDGTVGGRLRAPRLNGALTGNALRFEQQLLGWRFGEGRLDARFDDDRLRVQSLRFTSNRGAIELTGELGLPGAAGAGSAGGGAGKGLDLGRGRFELRAERLPLQISAGDRVVLSGATTIAVAGNTVRWSGALKADEGIIELTDLDTPSRPADLVVIDRRRPPAAGGDSLSHDPPRPAPLPVKFVADLDLDFGERFVVSGNGVDAKLRGVIKLSGELPGSPRANGTVALRQGKYRAYGQVLDITRGRLIFNGPLDNPLLDIVAMRRTQTVDAGVALSGTAQAPRVRLVSNPELSDAEKLSWLVLGTGLEDARTGSQTAALQAAAATLFGTGDGGPGFSQRLGLDSFGLGTSTATGMQSALPGTNNARGLPPIPGSTAMQAAASGGAQQNVVTAGKRLSDRLYLSYEQGLSGVWNLLKIQYDISRRFSIRALTGSESAVDLLFFHSFD